MNIKKMEKLKVERKMSGKRDAGTFSRVNRGGEGWRDDVELGDGERDEEQRGLERDEKRWRDGFKG